MEADPPASHHVRSADGTPIAVFTSGDGPPLILVHGTLADHTAFRTVAPLLERRFTLHAIDRRGRGASGDQPGAYAIERELEDVAAVADAVAADAGVPAAVVGHSFGGRCALGAALRSAAIARVVAYEGAPPAPGSGYLPHGLRDRLAALVAAGELADAMSTFLREIVGMSEAELAAYRANPIWPRRVATAPTILRELEAETAPEASLDALAAVRAPVLQVLGGDSLAQFGEAVRALDARLIDGRVATIPGAKHAAHHTHPEAFVAAVEAFLDA
jgi:pimeloyl-ACP methyl ester carboxylesterase